MKDRLMRLRISGELFIQLFSTGEHGGYYVGTGAIPSDAKIVNVRLGWPNVLEVLLRSESFGEITDGEVIPELEPVIETRAA